MFLFKLDINAKRLRDQKVVFTEVGCPGCSETFFFYQGNQYKAKFCILTIESSKAIMTKRSLTRWL